ncbi:MAG: AMP-binding protein [Arenicella sp.]
MVNTTLAEREIRFPHMDAETYLDRYNLSMHDRLSYWSARAEEFLDWTVQPKVVEEVIENQTHWFRGGELNVAYNCLDRHLETKGDNIAIVWVAHEEGYDRKISYKQLHAEVVSLSNALAARGLNPKEKVCIYATMLPETIVAMLACARLGVVYEFVDFLGEPEEVAAQVEALQPRAIITADKGVRDGKVYPLFDCMQKIADDVDAIETILVIRNKGSKVDLKEGRDIWYHEFIDGDYQHVEPVSVEADWSLFLSYQHDSPGTHLGFTNGGYLLYCAMLYRRVFDYQDGDVFWVATNFNVVSGHALAIWGALANGATTVIYDEDANKLDHHRFWDIVRDYQVNILYVREDGLEHMVVSDLDEVERQSWESLRVVGLSFSEDNAQVLARCKELRFDYCKIISTTNLLNTGQILFAHEAGEGVLHGLGEPMFGVAPFIVNEQGEEIEEVEAEGMLKLRYSWPSQNRLILSNDQPESAEKTDALVGQWEKEGSYINTGLHVRRDESRHFFLTQKKV